MQLQNKFNFNFVKNIMPTKSVDAPVEPVCSIQLVGTLKSWFVKTVKKILS